MRHGQGHNGSGDSGFVPKNVHGMHIVRMARSDARSRAPVGATTREGVRRAALEAALEPPPGARV